MTAFNTVRFRVKAGREQEFLDAHRKVAADWVANAHRLASGDPERIFTGRVLAGACESQGEVPSTRTDELPHDFTGQRSCDGCGNILAGRSSAAVWSGATEKQGGRDPALLDYRAP